MTQKMTQKWLSKMAPQEDSCTQSSRPCWNHTIWREWKMNFCLQNWSRFSKQISNILAPIRDNPSKLLLRGRPEFQLWRQPPHLYLPANQDDITPKILLFWIHLWTPEILLPYRDPLEPQWFWRSVISNWICTKINLNFRMIWSNQYSGIVVLGVWSKTLLLHFFIFGPFLHYGLQIQIVLIFFLLIKWLSNDLKWI